MSNTNTNTNTDPRLDPKAFPILGTVSHGTLRTCDLIRAFSGALRTVDDFRHVRRMDWDERDRVRALLADADSILATGDGWDVDDVDDADGVIEELSALLNEFAPVGYSFGAHDGDGSDFGFWPIDDADDAED